MKVAAALGSLACPSRSARPRNWLNLTLCIRPTKSVHPTYKSWASNLQKLCNRPTKVVHPTYKGCAFDLQNLCIRPTKVVQPTYKICASDLQMLCIWSTKSVHLTYKVVHSTNMCNQNIDNLSSTVMYILTISAVPSKVGLTKYNVHPIYSWRRSDVAVGPKFRRTEVL